MIFFSKKFTSQQARNRDYERFLDAITEIEEGASIYILDDKFRYVYFNQYHINSMRETFGCNPAIGIVKLSLLPADFAKRYEEIYKDAFEHSRYQYVEKIGNKYYRFNFYTKSPKELVVTFRDKTEYILMQQELESYRESLEGLVTERSNEIKKQRDIYQKLIDEDPNYLFLRDKKGQYVLVNQKTAESFNVTVKEVIGKSVIDLHFDKSEARRYVQEDNEILVSGQEKQSIERHDWIDGTVKWTFLKKKRIEIGGEYYILGVLTDITSLKKANEELEMTNRELETTLSELKEMQIKLVASEKMASIGQLTSGFAHEINNPINFVAGNIDPLRRDFDELLTWVGEFQKTDIFYPQNIEEIIDEIPLLLKAIEDGTARIKHLIKDLRNLSTPPNDELVLVDVNQDLKAVVKLITIAPNASFLIEATYGEIGPMLASPREMQQVYLNIIDYAIQQIEQNGNIVITTFSNQNHNFIKVLMKDVFLSVQEIEELFEPFSRRDRDATQLSLGLAIAYRIITKYKGYLHAETSEDIGTYFIIKMPIIVD